jgi:hypothetical protein
MSGASQYRNFKSTSTFSLSWSRLPLAGRAEELSLAHEPILNIRLLSSNGNYSGCDLFVIDSPIAVPTCWTASLSVALRSCVLDDNPRFLLGED